MLWSAAPNWNRCRLRDERDHAPVEFKALIVFFVLQGVHHRPGFAELEVLRCFLVELQSEAGQHGVTGRGQNGSDRVAMRDVRAQRSSATKVPSLQIFLSEIFLIDV